MNVLRRKIFEIDLIDLRGDLHVFCHLRRRGDEGERQLRVRGKLVRVGKETCDIEVKSGAVIEVSRYAVQEILDK